MTKQEMLEILSTLDSMLTNPNLTSSQERKLRVARNYILKALKKEEEQAG